MKQFGSATAQDLYDLFIRSCVFDQHDQYPHWELVDDDDRDDPVGDDWYVIVKVGNDEYGRELRHMDAARLWVAILACASRKVASVPASTADRCKAIIEQPDFSFVRIDAADADTVMQVALFGQVTY